MYKKLQKEKNVRSESEFVDENKLEIPEKSLVSVIGALNLKRWKTLKIVFSCKTNRDFVKKLLDIAEEFLNRNQKSLKKGSRAKKLKPLEAQQNCDQENANFHKNDISTNTDSFPQVPIPKQIEKKEVSLISKPENEGKKRNINRIENNQNASLDNNESILLTAKEHVEEKQTEKTKKDLNIIKIKLCNYCNTPHLKDSCPISCPHYTVKDAIDYNSWSHKYKLLYENHGKKLNFDKNDVNDEDFNKYSYSVLSLPDCLCIGESKDDLGIFAKNDLEPFSQFGPLVGKVVKEMDIPEDVDMKSIWEVAEDNRNIYFSTENPSLSNWIKYLRPAPKREDRNLTVISKDSVMYFVSVEFIKAGDELLYWQDCPTLGTKKKMEKIACGGCNIEFGHPHYYRIHCSIFHDIRFSLTIKKYYCKVCGAAVLGKDNIIRHAAELHNGQGAYQCQFCNKFFLRLNYLEMHRTYGCSANPHRSRPLCDFCGKKFCQPQKLKVHIKRMHSDISEVLKEFQCKSCLKILGSRAALQRHTKEVHQKNQVEGQCSCSRCGKKFQNKSNLKIHMLTHSGIKPFKCSAETCNAAFTTKQCLQFHYKKVHNFTEDSMPKIERSVDYTFQAYSGNADNKKGQTDRSESPKYNDQNLDLKCSDSDNESFDSQIEDDPAPQPENELQPIIQTHSPPATATENKIISATLNMKVLSKGSKKWIADDPPPTTKLSEIYSIERLSKDDFPGISLQEAEMYDRNKMSNINDFTRHDASNASLLVEAALDSVCNEPNLDIDVSTTPNCSDSLVNNLYNLTQPDNLADVPYNDNPCINDPRDLNLISPSVNDHVSVTDDLNDDLRDSGNIGVNYSSFNHNEFSPPRTPDVHRSNFVRNYINSLSPHNTNYEKNLSPVPSPPRFDFGHAVNTDRLSSDDSNGMAVQNLSIHASSKDDMQLDLSIYKSSYKVMSHDIRKVKFEGNSNPLDQDHIDVISQSDLADNIQSSETVKVLEENQDHLKYPDELSSDIRAKFDFDLDIRLKNYEPLDSDILRQRNHVYDCGDLDFRSKTYEFIEAVENRSKQYDLETDFRTDRNFEPLILNSSELQGLDMSARNFHNYPNISRYHHLYPDVDRVDLRLNYSPPPPSYTHADILRVVSLDLTSPGRHSVDLSLRSHPLHQIANSRLLSEHGLQGNAHRLLDQSRLIGADLATSRHLASDRIISETSGRILTDHTTSRILTNEPLSTNHLLNSDQGRIISDDSRVVSDQSRLLDQGRLISDSRILPPSTPSGSVSPVQAFSGYSVSQTPYHPTPIAPRPHVTSPIPTPYHYPTYY